MTTCLCAAVTSTTSRGSVEQRGYYELSASVEFGVITRCQDEDIEHPVVLDDAEYGDVPPVTQFSIYKYTRAFGETGEPTVFDLAPGRYEIGVGHGSHEPITATLAVRAAPGPVPGATPPP